ncbi:MAG: hypothetical protein EB023_11785 [Flavobacteriia bacterium]|nr:hypothetical protein [Flavobacteriia bacterium]
MKKKTNYLPVIIGLGLAGAAAYFFRDKIKDYFNRGIVGGDPSTFGPPEPNVITIPGPITTPTVDINAGVLPAPKKQLSPKGTPKDKLLMDEKLQLGDKGQEVAKLQQIVNRIRQINRQSKIGEDGDFGPGTQSAVKNIFGVTTVTLREAYYALFAYWNATNVKKQKDWYKYFYIPYFTDKTRLNTARANYFRENPVI